MISNENRKVKKFFINMMYSFSANSISLLISTIMILILPKWLSLEDYGIWQLYIFYLSYVGFLHFGWIDGMYLRYGGMDYSQLDRLKFSGQYYAFIILESVLILVVWNIMNSYVDNNDILAFLGIMCFSAFLLLLNTFFGFILQFTNRIKDYAFFISIERIVFLFLLVLLFMFGEIRYQEILWLDFFCKVVAFLYGSFLLREIISLKFHTLKSITKEMYINITIGSKLMFANVAGMLIIGIIRFGISQGWDVVTFGKISLTLNISNFFIVFITSISIVIFPILKRVDEKKLADIYITVRELLMFSLLGGLLICFPLKAVLSFWLPQYVESLKYMVVLFPVCLFESKVSLLINTYLKTLRKEKIILKTNIFTLFFSVCLTFFSVKILHNLDIAVFSIIFTFAFRCILAELYIERILYISLKGDILIELGMITSFIALNLIFIEWISVAFYGMIYIIFLYFNRKKLMKNFNQINTLLH